MLIRVFTLEFRSALGGFDDGELRDFLKDKEVLGIRDHFFVKDQSPYLAVVVTYNLLGLEEGQTARTQQKDRGRREEWREILQEPDWPLFNALRDWRNGQGKEEGVPPYVVCTNRQLAEIAHRRPPSLSKLATTEGLGKAKVERYGAAILDIVTQAAEPVQSATEEPSDEQSDQE
ncbi:MAG: HRDC domain-containing protein [Candidatus Latescibacteria bacterium]|jgi:ATP-dependent DNA helicase RecQ|nr:HRDC domain-containing protein [Candidatus Latescibacterota bacterium]